MRLTRIFVNAPLQTGAALRLPPAPAQHLTRVLRLTVGAALRVFNGQGGEYDASITSIRRSDCTLLLGAQHVIERESPLQVTLLQGIVRGEKMDLILQKATELGVAAVMPITTARSSVRVDDATALRKHAHWQGVIASACEQCGRNRLPQIATPLDFAVAIKRVAATLRLLLEPEPSAGMLKTLLHRATTDAAPPSICLLVGPEGGFDSHEVQQAIQAGFQPCRLGPRVLRTETAALTALAALQSLAGDLT
jgi:16S rRNA (uracil1498-N3)-methyltransferase